MPPSRKFTPFKYASIFTADSVSYYQEHIIEFVEDIVFQNDPDRQLTEQQKDLLLAIQNNKRVAAKSGKGVGKTGTISFAILWFLSCFSNPKVVCTAPSYPTLKSALWPEVAKWLNISLVKNIFTHTEDRLYLIEAPKNWFAEPRTAKEKENLQGLHEDNMLVIMDEASGIDQGIFEALDTTLTGYNNKFVMIGNPTQVSGPFFEAFNKFNKRWVTKTYSAAESPLVSKEQIQYYEEKYGKHHDLYLVNVSGEFPTGSPDAFIKLADISVAVERSDSMIGDGDIEIGLDVARFGDDITVLYSRKGFKVFPAKTLAKSSIVDCAELVLTTVNEIRRTHGYDKKIKVKVDDSGVGGGVVDILKLDRQHGIEVVPCNFGGKGNDTYHNEASTMWGRVKEFINVIGLPNDAHLIEELSARRWRMSPSGKIMIEPKSEYKKDFKSSPDRADALVLCFASNSNERSIIKNFDPLDSNIVKKRLEYIGSRKLSSVYYSRDLWVSVLHANWDGNKLFIYDEYVGEEGLSAIAYNLQCHQPINRIVGSESMFGDAKECLATKFRKHGIKINENYKYNELSAIDTVSGLFQLKRIIILEDCKKTIEQIRDWKMDYSKASQEREFGLCLALCNIISDLRNELKAPTPNYNFVHYNGERDKEISKIKHNSSNSSDWMVF